MITSTLDENVLGQQSPDEVSPEGYQDYFGFDDESKYVLPDGKQWISFRKLNEGKRAKYEAKTSRDVKFNRRTDDAVMNINTSADRHALILESVTGWHMMRRNRQSGAWEPVAFTSGSVHAEFDKWLLVADPSIVNDLYSAIQRANPWMTADMTIEMIDEEIGRLHKLRAETLERDAIAKNLSNR